jgi:hypothetical protein
MGKRLSEFLFEFFASDHLRLTGNRRVFDVDSGYVMWYDGGALMDSVFWVSIIAHRRSLVNHWRGTFPFEGDPSTSLGATVLGSVWRVARPVCGALETRVESFGRQVAPELDYTLTGDIASA